MSRPVSNWAKATKLLNKHENADWHLASVEVSVLAESAKRNGDVVERMLAAAEVERRNRELMNKLIRSWYFLVKNCMPHTTTFEDLVILQIYNSSEQLEEHQRTCPSNATYLSKATTSKLLYSISATI